MFKKTFYICLWVIFMSGTAYAHGMNMTSITAFGYANALGYFQEDGLPCVRQGMPQPYFSARQKHVPVSHTGHKHRAVQDA